MTYTIYFTDSTIAVIIADGVYTDLAGNLTFWRKNVKTLESEDIMKVQYGHWKYWIRDTMITYD